MNKVTESALKAEKAVARMEDKDEKDAKNRQLWMPVGGSALAGAVLFALLAIYLVLAYVV